MNRRLMFVRVPAVLAALMSVGTWIPAWAAPRLSVTPDTLRFGPALVGESRIDSFVVENAGDDSLTVASIDVLESSDYRLSHSSLPVVLQTRRFIRVIVEMRSRDTGCTTDRIVVTSDFGSDTVVIIRCAFIEQGFPDPSPTLLFPRTEVNRCSQRSVRPDDLALPPLLLYGIYSDDPDAEHIRSLVSIPFEGLDVAPQSGTELPFEFCPKAPRSFQARFRCVTSRGIFTVQTIGIAESEAQASTRLYYLDTATGNVGESVTLQLIADPPLTDGDLIDSMEFTIDFDDNALFLSDAQGGPATGPEAISVDRRRIQPGSERITMKAPSSYLTGRVLLRIEFVGLSTGLPSNVVRLSGSTPEPTDTLFSNGMVLLEGCTLGASRFAQRVAVESMALDAGGTQLVLRYSAADGANGTAAVIDASGGEVTRINLEPGNGSVQELRLQLDGFFPGLYGLLIEVADDRVILPFISPR